ncbi:MAG: hypothetical protein U1F68_11950 [Gammaproteobacteria bacterium]
MALFVALAGYYWLVLRRRLPPASLPFTPDKGFRRRDGTILDPFTGLIRWLLDCRRPACVGCRRCGGLALRPAPVFQRISDVGADRYPDRHRADGQWRGLVYHRFSDSIGLLRNGKIRRFYGVRKTSNPSGLRPPPMVPLGLPNGPALAIGLSPAANSALSAARCAHHQFARLAGGRPLHR